jgi:dihydrofolate reductase
MSGGTGKVVVNRAMSVDGFIAGPGDDMRWIGELAPHEEAANVAKATGAMLIGRRTWDVGARMRTDAPGNADYPFDGPMFVLTHRPLDPPDAAVTILSGDIGEAVATALAAAGGGDLELLGADVASQALRRGLVDEILVYLLPVVLGDGIPFSAAGSVKVDLDPIESRRAGAATILRFRVRR